MNSKNILLTGGHSGMGLELTKILLGRGHEVGLIVRSEKRKNDALKELGDSPKLTFFLADLSKREDLKEVAQSVGSAWRKIDVLFNNAGYGLYGAVETISIEEAKRQFDVNIFGLARVTKEVIPLMREQKSGTIINTSSMGGKV